jgi:thiamine kinase-like enzyme
MHRVHKILQSTFSLTDWIVLKPERGLRKECFVCRNNEVSVFVKFDVPVAELRRLSEIGVCPNIIATGVFEGASYVVQEFIAGAHPERVWLKNNISTIAQLVRRYHYDEELVKQLTRSKATGSTSQIYTDLGNLEERFGNITRKKVITRDITEGYKKFRELAVAFREVELVAVHAEPNFNNMLVKDDKLYFIDWDEITLSDPARDIGPLLWWYLPESQWEIFFNAYGETLTTESLNKIYWFAARISLDVALWHIENQKPDPGFFNDFVTAVNKRPNPQAI